MTLSSASDHCSIDTWSTISDEVCIRINSQISLRVLWTECRVMTDMVPIGWLIINRLSSNDVRVNTARPPALSWSQDSGGCATAHGTASLQNKNVCMTHTSGQTCAAGQVRSNHGPLLETPLRRTIAIIENENKNKINQFKKSGGWGEAQWSNSTLPMRSRIFWSSSRVHCLKCVHLVYSVPWYTLQYLGHKYA